MRALAGLLVAGALAACSASVEEPASQPTRPPGTTTSTVTTPPTSTTPGMSAEAVVEDPASTLQQLRLGPDGARAAVWRWCAKKSCRHAKYAIALSDDDFRTRVVPDLPTNRQLSVQAAGDGYVVGRGYGRLTWLLSTAGDLTRLDRSGETKPAAAGEVVLAGATGLSALDPDTGRMHRVPVPQDFHEFWQTGDRLYGIVSAAHGRSAYVVSTDGGEEWDHGSLPRRNALWIHVSGSARPAFIEGADGATLFPFVASWKLGSGSFRRASGPSDPTAYVSCAHRLRDGRLLVCVDDWSGRSKEPGLWVSTDRTWTDFERVAPGPPFADGTVFQPVVVAERESPQGLTLVLADPETGRAYATRDEGRHFQQIRGR